MLIKKILFSLLIILSAATSFSNNEIAEQHILVAMRMIGDRILLNAGDSTSRVLAVEKVKHRYKIEFENNFAIDPDALINIVNNVVLETNIANSYLVEIENCDSAIIIYSYEFLQTTNKENISCKNRLQPKECYKVFFTILSASNNENSGLNINMTTAPTPKNNYLLLIILPISFIIMMLMLIIYKNKRAKQKLNEEIIQIGAYLFDKNEMLLTLKKQVIELSGKEAELLFLLFSNQNKTLEREFILKVVWGDEGDYIGRTLDVFISKLRKKLENDPSIKIVNIRGVGYRFVMN